MFKFNKNLGFTLAELLVTIGLLGAIAAVTIPTLAYNYRGKVLEQQFRATYSDIKAVASILNETYGDWATYANKTAINTWNAEFMSKFNGGSPYRKGATYTDGVMDSELRELYGHNSGSGTGRFQFNISNKLTNATEVCDNGGVWTDSKGRIWTFNAENAMICVDVNGTAKPNRVNVDIFAFIPMSPAQLATFVYDDPGNANNYSGTIVPCNLELIIAKGVSNNVPKLVVDSNNDREKEFRKGSGSALDYCPFFQPVENVAVLQDAYCDLPNRGCGKSARGRTVTSSSNYWTDYIDYK